jgi:hypothetical protein
VALVKRKNSLGDMLEGIRQKVAHRPEDWNGSLGPNDTVLVPNMHFQIQHHFRELEGRDKVFLNPALSGLYLADAIQLIHFRLDRSGVAMSSWALQAARAVAKHYRFDRPFLLCLQRRGAQAPYFVMWVDNAELLQTQPQ